MITSTASCGLLVAQCHDIGTRTIQLTGHALSNRTKVIREQRFQLASHSASSLSPWQQTPSLHICRERFACECKLVEEVLAGGFLNETPARLIGHKTYDSDKLNETLRERYGIAMFTYNGEPHLRRRPSQKHYAIAWLSSSTMNCRVRQSPHGCRREFPTCTYLSN